MAVADMEKLVYRRWRSLGPGCFYRKSCVEGQEVEDVSRNSVVERVQGWREPWSVLLLDWLGEAICELCACMRINATDKVDENVSRTSRGGISGDPEEVGQPRY